MAAVAPAASQGSNDILSVEHSQTDLHMPPFDPAIHLAFEPPTARHSFTDLGLPKPKTAPDMCFTEPFQLFSEEGIRMIRRDLLRKEVLDKHLRSWDRAPAYIGSHEEVCRLIGWMHKRLIGPDRNVDKQHVESSSNY